MHEELKQNVRNQLEKSPHFVSVDFLPNFQKDHDTSLIYNRDVCKGMIVTLKPEYEITTDDIIWLHPNNARCRALFEGGTYEKITALPPTNALAGIYQTSQIDDIGDEIKRTFSIVDSHMHQNWTGSLQSVYSNKFQSESLMNCKQIAEQLGTTAFVGADYTNMLYKGTGMFHYYNAVYKDGGLVLHSPLIGYVASGEKDCPADWIDENSHLTNLSPQKLSSIYSKCDWNSLEIINTLCFKKSLKPVGQGVHYKPVNISLAVSPVNNMLSTKQVLEMTPVAVDIPEFMVVGDHVREDNIRLEYSDKIALKLLALRDTHNVLNMYSDNFLTLPRDIVQEII